MTVQAWGSAAALVAASVVVGQALHLLGLRCRAAGPAVGLAALIVIAAVAIKLPGRAVTAAIILLIAALAAAAVVVRGRRTSRPPVTALIALGMAAGAAAIPFIANGRVGLPGVSLDNDTANHLQWAQALRSPSVATRYGLPTGYPLGPHSLVDGIASGLGVRLDMAFTALLIATVLITAVVAAASLPGEAAWKKPIVGVLAALLYLPAAYYAEASFKETLLGLFLLAMVLGLEGLRRDWATQERRWLDLIPLAVLVAGALYVYSYPAIAWIGVAFVLWVVAETVWHPWWLRSWRRWLRDLWRPTAVAGAVLVLLILPSAGRLISFVGTIGVSPSGSGAITTSNLGNLAYALSPYQAFGVWNSPDFRLLPTALFHAGVYAGAALAVLLFGVAWSLRRRELILPAAVGACAIVYWKASHGQSPYVAAKALAIAGPVIAVTGARGLFQTPVLRIARSTAALRLAVAAGFLGLAAHSSYQALRDEPVWAPESTNELLTLDKQTRGQSVMFLGDSDYASWMFQDSDMSALGPDSVSMGQALPNPAKPNTYGTAFDFDSVSSSTINRFTWVVTSNTTYASQPPAAFRLVRRLPMYELWRREAPVVPRDVIEPVGQPGAILNCATATGRKLSRQAGVASVMSTPFTAGLSAIGPGASDATTLRVPAGTWSLSLQYVSPEPMEVTVGSRHWQMPAYDDRPGPFFAIGSVTTTGAPLVVTVTEIRSSSLTGPILVAQPTRVAAVPSPDPHSVTPLRRACGRYVDWYRLSSS